MKYIIIILLFSSCTVYKPCPCVYNHSYKSKIDPRYNIPGVMIDSGYNYTINPIYKWQ